MIFRGLDKNFNLLEGIKAEYMLWKRKYTAFGEFQARLDLKNYNPNLAYILHTGTNEVGIVNHPDLTMKETGNPLDLFGNFYESKLNDGSTTHMTNTSEQNIPTACVNYFNTMILGSSGGAAHKTNIELGTIKSSSEKAVFDTEDNTEFGLIAQSRLNKIDYSQRLRFDKDTKTFYYDIWQGKDRSIEGPDYCVFSDRLGNISNLTYSSDSSNYKNYADIRISRGGNPERFITTSYDWIKEGEEKQSISFNYSDTESASDTEARTKAQNDALLELLNRRITENITFEPDVNWYEYRKDYDLGDKVQLVITSLEIMVSFRIISVEEIYENGHRTIRLEFGDMKKLNYKKRW